MKNCQNCLKDFEPNSGKQKFCSDRCKVSFARKLAKGDVTTANKIKPPIKESIPDKVEKKVENNWVKEVEDFCNKENITPIDLIVSYNLKKSLKKESPVEKKELTNEPTFGDSFVSSLRKRKCGL
jgi:hypothetical protein